MENVLKYYEFSEFKKDNSEAFSNNEIAYTELNETHYLIFEKEEDQYNLYVSKFNSRNEIGNKKPIILELLVSNYDKSKPEHRLAITQYLN